MVAALDALAPLSLSLLNIRLFSTLFFFFFFQPLRVQRCSPWGRYIFPNALVYLDPSTRALLVLTV